MHTNFVLRQKNSMPTRYADGGGVGGRRPPNIFKFAKTFINSLPGSKGAGQGSL